MGGQIGSRVEEGDRPHTILHRQHTRANAGPSSLPTACPWPLSRPTWHESSPLSTAPRPLTFKGDNQS